MRSLSSSLATVKRLALTEREVTAHLLVYLAEMDARRLYLGEGCSSLFTYCTQVLHLSEHAAYGRIEAARAGRKFPAIFNAVASGALHLTAVSLIAPHLTAENIDQVIAAATHKTKREVEEIAAALRPHPPVPSSVRKVPQASQGPSVQRMPLAEAHRLVNGGEAPQRLVIDVVTEASDSAGARLPDRHVPRAAITPLAPEQYLVKFTASRATHEKLREAQALLRHQVPSGDVAEIVDRALTLLVADLRKSRHAAVVRPRTDRTTSGRRRYIPAAVKRAVWARDGGQCAFVGTTGRCSERGFLEYHHLVPFADGGETSASNLQLRCRAHNAFEAQRWSGPGEEDVVREVGPLYDGVSTDSGGSPGGFDYSVQDLVVACIGHLQSVKSQVPITKSQRITMSLPRFGGQSLIVTKEGLPPAIPTHLAFSNVTHARRSRQRFAAALPNGSR